MAFANPNGSLALVVLNQTDEVVGFTLAAEGKTFACTIPAHAIQSFVCAR